MVRKAIVVVMAVLVALLMVGTASAGSSISPDEITKNVPVGGTVDFTVTLKTSNTGPGVIAWRIDPRDPIAAGLEGAPLSKFGYIIVSTPPSTQTFTLTVATEDGATIGQEYIVQLNYCTGQGNSDQCTGNIAKARAEAGVIPTPELSTSILTATGLIGLIGLVRMKRKD